MPDPFAIRAGGVKPGPVPAVGLPELERYIAETVEQLWYLIQAGDVQIIQLEPLQRIPDKFKDGMVCFFRAGTVGIGPQDGIYGFMEGNWKRL